MNKTMTFKKLISKIESDLGLTVTQIRRCYHGRNQLGSGAFSWVGLVGKIEIRSTYTATELLKREKLEISEDVTQTISIEIQ